MFFAFRKHKKNDEYNSLASNIKNELIKVFEKKGIDCSQIEIDIRSGSLNVQVYVGKKLEQPVKG